MTENEIGQCVAELAAEALRTAEFGDVAETAQWLMPEQPITESEVYEVLRRLRYVQEIAVTFRDGSVATWRHPAAIVAGGAS